MHANLSSDLISVGYGKSFRILVADDDSIESCFTWQLSIDKVLRQITNNSPTLLSHTSFSSYSLRFLSHPTLSLTLISFSNPCLSSSHSLSPHSLAPLPPHKHSHNSHPPHTLSTPLSLYALSLSPHCLSHPRQSLFLAPLPPHTLTLAPHTLSLPPFTHSLFLAPLSPTHSLSSHSHPTLSASLTPLLPK